MFICCDCGSSFHEPVQWVEDRGECFGSPAYEQLSGSPCCYGAYVKAFRCSCCDEWITTEDYIKTNDGERYCEDCFQHMKLGDEY